MISMSPSNVLKVFLIIFGIVKVRTQSKAVHRQGRRANALPRNFGPGLQYFDKDLFIFVFTVIQNEKGFFPRKMSKVISTVIPRSTLDEAFVLPENEVCASCRHFQY